MKKYIKLSENPRSIFGVTGEQRQLAFQLWVAYDLYGRCNEDFAGQLRCPLIGCSISFESLGLCLQHLPTCAWLSNSWYWCPLCQRPERFAEPGPTLAQPPKLESGLGTPKCATLLPQKSTIAKISTTRFWKHIRNKSNLLSAHRILPMYRPRYNVDSVISHRQSPPGYEGRLPWDPHAFDPVQSAAAGTSMQHLELEAAPNSHSSDAWLNQLQELESSPTSQRSELQGNQHWTEVWNETPELHSNEPVYRRLLQLPGSEPFYTETEHVAPPYNQLVSPWAPTLPHEVIDSSSIANSSPYYGSAAQHYEPQFQPLDSMPTGLTPARHEGFGHTFGFNNTPARQSTSFGQSSCQISPFFDRSSSTGHGQARAMAKVESSVSNSTTGKTSIEGSRVTSREQCSKCGTEFNGSVQDRKHNKKRHHEFACTARAGPRERFECSTNGCNKSYSRPDNLAAHCQKKHQDVPALPRSNAQTVGWYF